MSYAIYRKVINHTGLPGICLRYNQPFKTFFASLYSYRQSSFDRLNSSVETKFTHDYIILNIINVFYLFAGPKYSNCYWQVESRATFFDIGWRHVDHNLYSRHSKAIAFDSTVYPLLAFLYSTVG